MRAVNTTAPLPQGVEVIERNYKTGDCETCGCLRRLTLVREGPSLFTSALHDLCSECMEVFDV